MLHMASDLDRSIAKTKAMTNTWEIILELILIGGWLNIGTIGGLL